MYRGGEHGVNVQRQELPVDLKDVQLVDPSDKSVLFPSHFF